MAKGGVRVRGAAATQPFWERQRQRFSRGARGPSVVWTWEVLEAVIAPRLELRKVPEVVVVPRVELVEHPVPIEPVCVTVVVVCVET
jgi:hypothetical protein